MQADGAGAARRGRGDVVGVGGARRPERPRRRCGRPRAAAWSQVLEDEGGAALGASRSRRAGRRRAGTCPMVDSAVMLAKAAMPTPVMAASAPPPMATSQRPVATRRAACADGVGARPRRRWRSSRTGRASRARMETCGRAGVGHHHGDEEGRDPPRALLVEDADLLLERLEAADPGGEDTPERSGSAPMLAGVGRAPCRPRPPRTGRSGRRWRTSLGPNHAVGVEVRAPGARPSGGGPLQAVPEGVEADPAARRRRPCR